MKVFWRAGIGLFLALAVLLISGQLLPRPLPPAIGQIISLSDGQTINVYQKGEGQSIVLVHGLPGSAEDWPEFVDALVKRGFHVIWYDRIGYGHSSRRIAGVPHTMQASGRELDLLIDALNLENPALVGWSFGGGSVQTSKAARSANTPFIVLLASVGPAMQVADNPVDFPGSNLILRAPVLGHLLTKLMIAVQFDDPIPSRWAKSARPLLLMPGAVDTMRAEMSQMKPATLQADFNTPTLIIHGRQDKMVNYEVSEALLAGLGNAKLETIENAGHMLPMGYPDQIAHMIQSFANLNIKELEE